MPAWGGTVEILKTPQSMAKHGTAQSQLPVQRFCPLLWYDLTWRRRPDVASWHVTQDVIYVTPEQLCSCSATVFSIHNTTVLSVLFTRKHITAQQKVFYIEFSAVETVVLWNVSFILEVLYLSPFSSCFIFSNKLKINNLLKTIKPQLWSWKNQTAFVVDLQKRWGDVFAHAILWGKWHQVQAADLMVNASISICIPQVCK